MLTFTVIVWVIYRLRPLDTCVLLPVLRPIIHR